MFGIGMPKVGEGKPESRYEAPGSPPRADGSTSRQPLETHARSAARSSVRAREAKNGAPRLPS